MQINTTIEAFTLFFSAGKVIVQDSKRADWIYIVKAVSLHTEGGFILLYRKYYLLINISHFSGQGNSYEEVGSSERKLNG